MRLSVNFGSSERLGPEVRALAQRIGADDASPPPQILGPATSLADLDAAVTSALAGRMIDAPEDRSSLRDDLARAFDALGPATQAAATQPLTELRQAFSAIPTRLTSVAGAQRLQGLIETSRSGFGAEAVVKAAWTDVLAAFTGDGWAQCWAETCELRLLQLSEIVELGGGDWPHLANGLKGILYDDRLRMAEFDLLELEEGTSLTEPAGVSLEQRLAWCEQILAGEPERGDVVVWVGFSNAMLGEGYLKVGEVEFFTGQLWPEGIKEGWPDNDARRREEMASMDPRMFFFGEPPELPFVLARMHLGEMSVVQSTQRARRLIQDLIRAARPGSEWELMDGALAYVRGENDGWYGAGLQVPWEGSKNVFSPEFEPTADSLEALDDMFVGRLLADDPHLHAAVRDIDWLERISELDDPAQRVGLGVRLIERLLPKDEHWAKVTSYYLRDAWALNRIGMFIADATHNAVGLIEHPMPVIGRHEPWRQRLLPRNPSSTSYQVRYVEMIESASELLEIMPPYMLATRTVQEVAERTRDEPSVLAWKDALTAQFDQLLARLVRQRNVILHGGDAYEPVTESVKFFLGWVQGSLATHAIEAVRREVSPSVQLEERRTNVRKRWAALEGGASPIDVLFGADADSEAE
jgi:hypothetical protein